MVFWGRERQAARVASVLRHFLSEPSACAYLPDRESSLEYRLMLDVEPDELETLLARGWRRFGPAYFRPGCQGCRECVPLRIPLERFQPSRQQRRALRKLEELRVEVGVPRVDAMRLQLYHQWHEAQGGQRGWSADHISAEEYYHQFAFPHPCAREFAYYHRADDGVMRLVAVAIVDETPRALSAVYTYHDPEYAKWSLGTISILCQIKAAIAWNKTWLYLGYRVLGCQSSEYKARFQQHELLSVASCDNVSPLWVAEPGRSKPQGE